MSRPAEGSILPASYRHGGPPVTIACLIEGDVLAGPEERYRARVYSPTQKLLAAVLQDAIACATGHIKAVGYPNASPSTRALRRVRTRRMARAWLRSDRDDAPYWFTFRACCTALRLDPAYVRRRIAALTTKPRGRHMVRTRDMRVQAYSHRPPWTRLNRGHG